MSQSGQRGGRPNESRRRSTAGFHRSSTVKGRLRPRDYAARRPVSRRPPRRSRTLRRLLGVGLLVLILLVVAGIALGGYAAYRQYTVGYVFTEPARGGSVSVTIPPGASLKEIATILEEHDVVASARAFRGYVEGQGKETTLRPGTYTFALSLIHI